MLRRFLLRLPLLRRECISQRSIYQSEGAKDPSPETGVTLIFLSKDRSKFYRSMGLFCLVQGAAWATFTGYLLFRSNVDYDRMISDLNQFNRNVAAKLESLTPENIAKLILRRPTANEQKESDQVTVAPEEKTPDAEQQKSGQLLAATSNEMASSAAVVDVPTTVKNNEKKHNSGVFEYFKTESKVFADAFQAKLGIVKEENKMAVTSTKILVPFVTGVMCIFTFFIGGIIPRRVIRKISILPKGAMSGDSVDPTLAITTYGTFGVYPRAGARFITPLSHVRAIAPHAEGTKFMSINIQGRLFVFYLEKFQVEFILPEYFDHLNNNALKKPK